eukprot:1992008-Rhodomonas_salina.1
MGSAWQELVINMFGNWITDRGRRFPNFFYDGWNIFDLVVVLISVVAAAFEDAPGVNGLRIMRVFRVRLQRWHRLAPVLELTS